ncbi:MAG: NAD(P)/FAD-dependent oxidoreductase, partial [Caulobacteraceae bacterium]
GDLSAFFHRYHQARGVEFEVSLQVVSIDGDETRKVRGVTLSDGRVIACDAVLVGVGAVPNLELAREAGLSCANGVVVDGQARTSDPDIFAVGDVTWRPLPLYGRDFRLESVPNALEQAKQAAAAIVGRNPPPPEVPWFWSDQYDLKLQIAGLVFDPDATVLRGDVEAAKFAVFHLKAGKVQAVEAVNAPAEFMGGRLLIASGKTVDPLRLADLSISMKEVAA